MQYLTCHKDKFFYSFLIYLVEMVSVNIAKPVQLLFHELP